MRWQDKAKQASNGALGQGVGNPEFKLFKGLSPEPLLDQRLQYVHVKLLFVKW